MTEMMFDYDEDLFDACFEAWSYGPVDREIHLWYKELSDKEYADINLKKLDGVDENILEYIDYLINKIINTNDFVLIDLSQEDKCWSEAYIPNKKNHMDNEAIKTEYACKWKKHT